MKKFKMRLLLATVAAMLATLSSICLAENPKVALETNLGTIVLELYPDKAPKSVENFLGYVKSGHYDATIFHRVIDGFMIQGGGFGEDMRQKPTKAPIQNEADNGLQNDRLTVAMARTNDPHSATAQFFINTVNNSFLNFSSKDARGWGYAVFGKVIEGEKVVDAISKTPTGPRAPFGSDVPNKMVVIKSAKVVK